MAIYMRKEPSHWIPNPICWYKFDGDYTDDTGTYGNATGTATFQTLSGGIQVLQTNGSNTVNLPLGITLYPISTWTIAFWCKPLATAYFAGCNGESNFYDLAFYMSTGGRCYAEWGGGSSSHTIASIDKTDSTLGNDWRLFILKGDGSRASMNINGSPFYSAIYNNTSIFWSGRQFAFGGRASGVQMSQVLISNFIISDTYRSDENCGLMFDETKSDYGY